MTLCSMCFVFVYFPNLPKKLKDFSVPNVGCSVDIQLADNIDVCLVVSI